jgi:hypothetical protein
VALAALDSNGSLIRRKLARDLDPDLLPSSPRSLSIDRACRFNSRTSARVWARMSEAFSAPWAARYSAHAPLSSSFVLLRFSAK